MPSLPSRHPSSSDRPHRATRGSTLIVALLICAVIGISLASYLKLAHTSLVVSNRALYSNAAMNLAENGLEEAMYSINKKVADSSYSWTADGWSTVPSSITDVRRSLPASGTYAFDQHATGSVRVYVYGYAGAAPKVIARSTINLAGTDGGAVEKWVQIQLRKTSKFSNGLVAKGSITFNGNNASVDSWNSAKNDDGTPRSAPAAYSSAVKHDKGSVGSISVAVNAVLVQNADIWGYAATGGVLPSVGSQGRVGPFGTAAGTMDPNHVSTDFSASFDPAAMPATGTSLGSIGSTTALGTAGTTQTLTYTAISLSGNKQLTIQGDVTLLLTSTGSAISISGNAGITLAAGSSLIIYTAGDISIAGNGVANPNLPEKFQIWGTKTTGTQSIGIAGNGTLSGIVYAPQGSVTINGNGDVCGSVVANDITLTGNASFHYDEALADFGGDNPYRVSKWTELTTATDRAAYNTLMSF